jgi:hypothetical protein
LASIAIRAIELSQGFRALEAQGERVAHKLWRPDLTADQVRATLPRFLDPLANRPSSFIAASFALLRLSFEVQVVCQAASVSVCIVQ